MNPYVTLNGAIDICKNVVDYSYLYLIHVNSINMYLITSEETHLKFEECSKTSVSASFWIYSHSGFF